MTFYFKYNPSSFVSDFKRYLFLTHKDTFKELAFFLLCLVLYFFLNELNNYNVIDWFPKHISKSRWMYLFVILGIAVFELWDLVYDLLIIRFKTRNTLRNTQSLILTDTQIEFISQHNKKVLSWDLYENIHLLNDSILIEPLKRKTMPIRINKNELSEKDFGLVKEEINKCFKIIKEQAYEKQKAEYQPPWLKWF